MNEKWLKKLDIVHKWMPVIVYICASVGIIWNIVIYAHNDVGVVTYSASSISIMITFLISVLICDRLYKLERGKNGA